MTECIVSQLWYVMNASCLSESKYLTKSKKRPNGPQSPLLWIKYKYKYFAFSPIKYSSTSSTDKIVLKYKYKYRYLTTTLEWAALIVSHQHSVYPSLQGNSVVTDVQFGHLFLVCIKYVALQEVTCGLFRKISHCSWYI